MDDDDRRCTRCGKVANKVKRLTLYDENWPKTPWKRQWCMPCFSIILKVYWESGDYCTSLTSEDVAHVG